MVDDPAFKANVIDNPRSWFNDQRVVSHIVRRLVCEYGYAGKVSDTYDERGEYSFRVPYDVFRRDVEKALRDAQDGAPFHQRPSV